METEKVRKIFLGVSVGFGLIITIIGGSLLLKEKKYSNHNTSETVSHREETLHERLVRSTNANERLNVYKNSKAHGNKTKKLGKNHKNKTRKYE